MAALTEFFSKALGFTGARNVAPTVTAGASGEDLGSYGYTVNIERSPALQGKRRWRTYQDLVTNTLIVAASIRYVLDLVAGAEWTVEPPKDEDGEPLPGSEEVAKFVQDVLDDMETPWSRVVRRAAMFRMNGFSIQEWTAKKREDGRLGMKDVEPRPCSTIERWDTDEGGSVVGVTQLITGRPEVYLPRGKIIYLVDDALDTSVEGTGLLRHVVRAGERLRAFEELEELAFETDLRGIPIGRAPLKSMREDRDAGKITDEQIKRARKPVDDFVRNKIINKSKGAVLDSETYNGVTADGGTSPSGTRKWDVELLSGDSKGEAEVALAIQRLNREIAILFGTEHLLLGSDGTGSLALGQTKLSSTLLMISSLLGEIATGYNRDFVAPVCSLNGIDKKIWPKLTPQDIDVADVEAIARALADLSTAFGPTGPEDPARDKVRARMGLPPAPPPTPEDEMDAALRAANARPGASTRGDPNQDIKPGSEGSGQQQTQPGGSAPSGGKR